MGRLAEKLAEKKRVITAEITPPKGAGIKKLLAHAELLRPLVDAINITDCQRALVKMSSLAASRVLLDHGMEPVFQLTCRDRNLIALQSDLMGASALGIRNLLCLTGDPVKAGDCPESKSVFDVESVRLLNIVQKLQSGRDFHDQKMNAATKFFVGAVVNPTLRSGGSQLTRMEKKAQAGAKFFQTQANYDLEDFRAFLLECRRVAVPVLAGVLILHSGEMAHYIHDHLPGVNVPQPVLDQFHTGESGETVGIDFAVQTMLKLEDVCDGFHVMSVRAEHLIPLVLEKYYAASRFKKDASS